MATPLQHQVVLQHVQLYVENDIERLKGLMADGQAVVGDAFVAGQEYQKISDRINVRLKVRDNIQSYSGDSYEFLLYMQRHALINMGNEVVYDAWNDACHVALSEMRARFDGVGRA